MASIKIGADPFPPYQYIGGDGKMHGSDYHLLKSIFEKISLNVSFIIKDWSVIEKAFNDKEIDVLFQVQKTKERETKYFFSDKLRDAKTGIATSNVDEVDKFNDIEAFLQEKKYLGVLEGYQYGAPIDNVENSLKIGCNNDVELFQYLKDSVTKYAVFDVGVFDYLSKKEKRNVFLLKKVEFLRPLYVMFHSEALRDQFNRVLQNYRD